LGAFKAGVITVAFVVIDAIDTKAAIETRVAFTVIDICLTLSSRKSSFTDASKIVDSVNASGIKLARVTLALVDFGFTIRSRVSWCASTAVRVD